MFTHFEEGGLLSETRDYAEIGNKYYDDSNISLLLSEEVMDVMSPVNESDA